MSLFRITIITVLLYASSLHAIAQVEEAWNISLDSVTIKGFRHTSGIKTNADGSLKWNMEMMDVLPKILGNADPIHYIQMLPGIQTNNEYRSGTNMNGCDNQHNLISIEGVPIYNVNHLLGFFSTFNPIHYPSMTLSKCITPSTTTNHLGGEINLQLPDTIAKAAKTNFSLGLVSSQGSILLPFNEKLSLTLSGRGSYINLLYSRWLKAEDQQVNYSFYDTNATLIFQPSSHNTFTFDFYHGKDMGSFEQGSYLAKMRAGWGNNMAAIHWRHKNGSNRENKSCLYFTSYHNQFRLSMQEMTFELPSSITDIAFQNRLKWNRIDGGMEFIAHNIHPQSLKQSGSYNVTSGNTPPTHSKETSIYINYAIPIVKNIHAKGGIHGSMYLQDKDSQFGLDPSVALNYDNLTTQLSLCFATRHQYLFQTGFSNMGLPTEFWFSSNKQHYPQYTKEVNANANMYLFKRRWMVSASLFFMKLYHQMEYKGSVLDFANTIYDLDRSLLHGNGKNFGFNLMLNKCTGKLTGWVSYAYTYAHRQFNEIDHQGSYPASHERPHEVNAVMNYKHNRHWLFCGTFVYASGLPYTKAQSLYLINNNIIIEYGEHNADRLNPYIRLDISASYQWKRKSWENGINFSLYNTMNHKNELFYYIKSQKDGTFAYRPVTFILNVLPSISYSCKF